MNMLEYSILSAWSGRAEPAQTIAEKFLRTLDAFEASDPLLKDWTYDDEDTAPDGVPIEALRDDFAEFVEQHAWRDDYDEPDPEEGYMVWAGCGYGEGAGASLLVHAGSEATNGSKFSIGEKEARAASATAVTYPLFRSTLLTMVAIWPAPWACATCDSDGERPDVASGDPTFPYSEYQMPWLGYLSAERAKGLVVPAELQSERTPDGGLLITAAEQRLDPANPQHMARSKLLAEIMIERGGNPGY